MDADLEWFDPATVWWTVGVTAALLALYAFLEWVTRDLTKW